MHDPGDERVRVVNAAFPLGGTLRRALGARADLDMVGDASTVEHALALIRRLVPDVAILGAGLPEGGGAQACASIMAADISTRVLVVSESSDQAVLLAAVEAGADGYLTATDCEEDVVRSVLQVHGGHAWVPTEMLGTLLRDLIRRKRQRNQAAERFACLSRREREVVSLLAAGLDHRGIAETLYVSPHTARTHIQNLLAKLGLHSRAEAAAFMIDHELVLETEDRNRPDGEVPSGG